MGDMVRRKFREIDRPLFQLDCDLVPGPDLVDHVHHHGKDDQAEHCPTQRGDVVYDFTLHHCSRRCLEDFSAEYVLVLA